ncbi:MAG TPA: hypothetical protein VNA87_00955 [Actinomycetota bacterium]|nr:hypothetical protein [Actinomycetota bacterium]
MSVLFVGALAAPAVVGWFLDGNQAGATHVSSNATSYAACERVFPDPHSFWPSPIQLPGRSPFAKGRSACASGDFLQYQEMIDGTNYLEKLFPDFVELHVLEDDFGDGSDCATSTSPQDLCSAGLPRQGATPGRVRSDLYMLRVSDERVPDTNKKFFVFLLSVHGIERAGAEGGVRAAEDLATWAYCEAKAKGQPITPPADSVQVNCGREGKIPHAIMETNPESFNAGDVLAKTAIYFVFANPDGWRRGDTDNLARFYQRYNGNGVDLNRDTPSLGFVERRYTPWSEPESRGIGQVLKSIRPKWDGAIDLHGQIVDRAFSFTMLGQAPADYGKNQRILQVTKGAWKDAEERLGWSPLIIPNDQPQTCQPAELVTACDRMYGVQWGTVWDTIAYTTTGAHSDWMGFEDLGLGADALGNEMSFSHLGNCGTGTCYEPAIEQLHIDGNKSLIYGMVNYTLLPEDQSFRVPGKVGYVLNPKRVKNSGTLTTPPSTAGLSPQSPILDATLNAANDFTQTFTVLGPNQGHYNGGLEGKATPLAQVGGISGSSVTTAIVLEQFSADEADPGDDGGCGAADDSWTEVNRYYNQSAGYLQSGQAVHANDPTPGRYRICIAGDFTMTGGSSVSWDLDITFSTEKAWEDPGQAAYDASNMDFFKDLAKYMQPGQLVPLTAEEVLAGKIDLKGFTSIVIADDPFPGYSETIPTGPAQPSIVHQPPAKTTSTIPCFYDPDFGGVLFGQCTADYEFDVSAEFNNQSMKVALDYDASDEGWALVVERQMADGTYRRIGYSNTYSGHDEVVVLQPQPVRHRARIINSGNTGQPSKLEISFSNVYGGPPLPASTRSPADLAKWTSSMRGFVEQGGNLVLTDGALRNLAYMGLAPRLAVRNSPGYAGFVRFTHDGTKSTYNDPLAAEIDQPGAAEGPGFRHQTYEPVPIGFQLPEGRDPFTGFAPNWTVDQGAWKKAGGRTVGMVGADEVVVGELASGAGRVRILGSLLPMPTEDYYHPFGLASYSVTYTGYQLLLNALQWPEVGGGTLAATGPASLQLTGMATLILGLYLLGRVRSRRAIPRATRTPPNVPPNRALVRDLSMRA